MPEQKICPFHPLSPGCVDTYCRKSECELWSTVMSMCSISVGMIAILSVADTLKGISENIKNHYPD